MSKELLEAWFDAFRTKDISKLKLAEDFVHTSPFGEIKGRDTYLNMVRENADTFFSKTITIQEIFDCGDRFAVRYLVDDFPACECIYVDNGEISKIVAYYHFGEKPVLPELTRWYGG